MHRHGQSFEDLLTIDNVVFPSFHDATVEIGLFANQNEGFYVLTKAITCLYMASQLRFLFSCIVLEGYPAHPLWDKFHDQLRSDFSSHDQPQEIAEDMTLSVISDLLSKGSQHLSDYGLPEPQH